ncbi:MAG: ATP-binding protein [Myxococcales bacterium]|nr:MAG: ATP-binding protein [Myxococcales bacterium]
MKRDIATLIRLGENEHIEFKSTVRWDMQREKVNKKLSDVVAKTIAALANHGGGSLLIGINDDGKILGLNLDYQTLKKPNRDGFEQLVMTLVRERLGGHVCRLIHVLFANLEGHDVCRIVVEPSDAPIFFDDGTSTCFFVRTGNASRELDVRETIQFVASRWNEKAAQPSRALDWSSQPPKGVTKA